MNEREYNAPITATERKAAEDSWPTGEAAKTLPKGMVETRYDETSGEWVDLAYDQVLGKPQTDR
jgi:hypothetical protein